MHDHELPFPIAQNNTSPHVNTRSLCYLTGHKAPPPPPRGRNQRGWDFHVDLQCNSGNGGPLRCLGWPLDSLAVVGGITNWIVGESSIWAASPPQAQNSTSRWCLLGGWPIAFKWQIDKERRCPPLSRFHAPDCQPPARSDVFDGHTALIVSTGATPMAPARGAEIRVLRAVYAHYK